MTVNIPFNYCMAHASNRNAIWLERSVAYEFCSRKVQKPEGLSLKGESLQPKVEIVGRLDQKVKDVQ